MFFDGIMYLNIRGCESAQMFLTRLSLLIETTLRNVSPNDQRGSIVSTKQESETDHLEGERNLENMRHYILGKIKDREILFAIDGCEYPLEDDGVQFAKEIDDLLTE